jgi:2-C-methyl-D-erythritol 4-phosphate cytidylyltransferase
MPAACDAIIVAAGTSERFGGTEPKQFVALHQKPILLWSVERLAESPAVDSIVIVVTPGAEDRTRDVVGGVAKVKEIVPGGATRQESVRLGLDALPDESTNVLVHDAARPCLSARLLASIIEALDAHEAVVPAVPVADTLVHAPDGEVDAILDRVHVKGVQTPQAFRTELLRRAHRRAVKRGFTTSDDGSLVLALDEKVHVVPGETSNMKITVESDLRIAEAILAQELKQR